MSGGYCQHRKVSRGQEIANVTLIYLCCHSLAKKQRFSIASFFRKLLQFATRWISRCVPDVMFCGGIRVDHNNGKGMGKIDSGCVSRASFLLSGENQGRFIKQIMVYDAIIPTNLKTRRSHRAFTNTQPNTVSLHYLLVIAGFKLLCTHRRFRDQIISGSDGS